MVIMIHTKSAIESVKDDFLIHKLMVIPVDYKDMGKNISPYDFYFCESPEEATSNIQTLLGMISVGSYFAVKIDPDSNIAVLRIIEEEGGNESLKGIESKYGTLPRTAIVKTPVGYDHFFKGDTEWLRSQTSSIQSTYFEFTGHAHPDQLEKYLQEMVIEKPYYRGHELKQIEIAPGINLILDGFVIIPPSQWYDWYSKMSLKSIPRFPNEIIMI